MAEGNTRIELSLSTDNSEALRKAAQEAVNVALEAVGMQAESYAKMLCRVDTGLLRNSITHALGGRPAAISSYENNAVHADTELTRRAGTAGQPTEPRSGTYDGEAPDEPDVVYIGTNVEYAPYVELGSSKTAPHPFLEPAIMNHQEEYIEIFEEYLHKL